MFCDNGTEKKFKVFALTNPLQSVSQGIVIFGENEEKKGCSFCSPFLVTAQMFD
jgi:hypothetical protein